MLTFNYRAAHGLRHEGDCGLMGVTPAGHIYAEEFYGEDWLAQHHLDETGRIIASVDEGTDEDFAPLPLPENFTRPALVRASHPLNYIGARHRGMREAERLSDLAQSLTIAEKMALLNHLALKIPPMMLAGIAESRVLSEASLEQAGLYLVCRRVLLAVMLPEPRLDADGLPYDYETIPLHLAHLYDDSRQSMPELHEALSGTGGITLTRPLECLTYEGKLYLAEGGRAGHKSCVHVWTI